MGPLLYRICRPLSLAGGLLLPALVVALPVEQTEPLAPDIWSRSGRSTLGLPAVTSAPGLDPAPWASSLSPGQPHPLREESADSRGRASPDPGFFLDNDALQFPLGAEVSGSAAELEARDDHARGGWAGLRDLLMETPMGQEILLLGVETLSPSVDSTGRIHVSILGHGDFTLPRLDPPPPTDALDALLATPADPAAPLAWSRATTITGLDSPLTVRALIGVLADELMAFVTHPLTLFTAALGGIAYIALRLSLERRSLRAQRHRHHRRHRHAHPSHRHTRKTRGGLPEPR